MHVSDVDLLDFETSYLREFLLMVSDSLLVYFDTYLMHPMFFEGVDNTSEDARNVVGIFCPDLSTRVVTTELLPSAHGLLPIAHAGQGPYFCRLPLVITSFRRVHGHLGLKVELCRPSPTPLR